MHAIPKSINVCINVYIKFGHKPSWCILTQLLCKQNHTIARILVNPLVQINILIGSCLSKYHKAIVVRLNFPENHEQIRRLSKIYIIPDL